MVDSLQLQAFLAMLHEARQLPVHHPVRLELERAVDGFVKDGKRRRKSQRRREAAAADRAAVAATSLGASDRIEDVSVAEQGVGNTLNTSRRCYSCKEQYFGLDSFYHWLCSECAADNQARRKARTDLTGRRALVTGGRVKIGFQVARMLLRDGAHVTVTTRFPADAMRRFAADPETSQALERLRVIGVDLRDPRQVLGLTEMLLAEGQPLDIVVNNAAQTVRRPAWSYAQLVAAESSLPGIEAAPGFVAALPEPEWTRALGSSAVTTTIDAPVDASGLVPDPSPVNSWTARVGAVDPAELLEVQLINTVAPFLLVNGLLPLMVESPHSHPRRYVVNVSAVEGWFAAGFKSGAHPHTNMAKAALNMLTRTSAEDLAAQGVYLTSVDTGWITDENPMPVKESIADTGWRPPLDVLDGASRIYDPIVRGEQGDPPWGVLLKDYRVVDW